MSMLDKVLGPHWKKEKPLRMGRRLNLQTRDMRLLKLLLEQKFLSWEQIRDHIFGGHKRYAYVRLWKLRRFDLVRKFLAAYTGYDLYSATTLAQECLREQFEESLVPFTFPNLEALSHELLVTDIRFLFEEIQFGSSWTSERVWRSRYPGKPRYPDAVIGVNEGSLTLHVERSPTRERFNFLHYEYDFLIPHCLCVTEESHLKLFMEKAEGSPGIYFTTATELLQKKEATVFRNAQGRIFSLRDNLNKTPKAIPSS